MVSWADKAHARLTFLSIKAKNANFDLAFGVWAEDEAVALLRFDHIRQLRSEDIVATVLAFFLTCVWIDVLDGQVLVEGLRVELTLGGLAIILKVDNCRDLHIARVLLLLSVLSALLIA